MPKVIIMNSTNYVAGSNNKFVYNLPNETKFIKGQKIGMASVAIYNSTFNITPELKNNTYQIKWPGLTPGSIVTYDIVIPNSYMDGPEINFYLQSQFVERKLYMTSDNGTNNIYFAELLNNNTRYKFQINTFPIPTASQATNLGYAMPVGATTWALPTTSVSPQLIICPGLGTLLGFTTSQLTFPDSPTYTVSKQYLSDVAPKLSPIASYIFSLNLINSRYSRPNNIFCTIPLEKGFGQMCTLPTANIVYCDISEGNYSDITLEIFDQAYNKVFLNDTDVVFTLVVDESI